MPPAAFPKTSLRQRLQGLVRRLFWGMDIDPGAWIAPSALIDRTWPRGIHIGPGCIIDHEAVILAHDMTRGLYLDTVIGAGSRIGARAIVFPGVTVGRDCIVEPGANVTRDIADGIRVAGNPAVEVERRRD